MPDRGKRIRDYTEKVRAAITKHERLKKTTEVLSKFQLEFEENQNEVKEKSQMARLADKKTLVLPAETLPNKGSNSTSSVWATAIASNEDLSSPSLTKNTLHGKIRSNVDTTFTVDTVSEMSHKRNVDVGKPPVQQDKIPQTAKNKAGTADGLVDSLKMISINDCTERGGGSKTSNQLKNFAHPVAKPSHYLDVIEKRAGSPVLQKEKFRPNRYNN